MGFKNFYICILVTRVLLVTTRVPSLSTYGLDSQENLSGKNEIQLALQQKRTISERGFYCKEHAKKSPTRDLCICQKYYDYRVRAEFQAQMGPKLLASLSFCVDQLSRGSLLPLFNNGQGGAREALALYYYYHLPALPPSQFNSSTLLLRRTRIGMNFSFMSPTKSNIIQQVHANQNLWKNPKKV